MALHNFCSAAMSVSGRFGDAPIGGFHKGLLAVQLASGTNGWRFHDLRRSTATGLQRLGAPEAVIDATLAHTTGGIRRHYHHHPFIEERRAALASWGEELAA